MKTASKIAIVGIVLLAASLANAAVVTYGPVSSGNQAQGESWSVDLQLNQFDPSLGTLDKVILTLDAGQSADVTIENDSTTSGVNVTVTLNGTVTGTAPNSLVAISSIIGNKTSGSLAATDGTPGSGPDYEDLGTISDTTQATDEITSNFSPYIGTGTFTVTIDGVGGWSFSGTNDATLKVSDFVGYGDASVTYEYTVPEPATMGLMGLGGLGMLLRRRRKMVA